MENLNEQSDIQNSNQFDHPSMDKLNEQLRDMSMTEEQGVKEMIL